MNKIDELMALADSFAEYRDHSEYVHARDKLRQALEAALFHCREATLCEAAVMMHKS